MSSPALSRPAPTPAPTPAPSRSVQATIEACRREVEALQQAAKSPSPSPSSPTTTTSTSAPSTPAPALPPRKTTPPAPITTSTSTTSTTTSKAPSSPSPPRPPTPTLAPAPSTPPPLAASAPAPISETPDTFAWETSLDALTLPNVDEVDVDLAKTTPTKLVSLLESAAVSPTSLERALEFRPRPDDVVVAASPLCGQALFAKLVRLLGARDQAEFEREMTRDAPILESRVTDMDPDALRRTQASKRRRVFRTNMTYKVLAEHLDDEDADEWSGPDFVVVARDPADLRFQWFEYVRRSYVAARVGHHRVHGQQGAHAHARDEDDSVLSAARAQATIEFDARFSSADFAGIPVTLVEPGMDASRVDAYEANLADWLSVKQHPKVLILFLEEFLAQPERVLDRLTLFLNERFDPLRRDDILRRLTGAPLLDVKWLLTPTQRRMIRYRFAFAKDAAAGDAAASSPPARSELEALMDRSHNVSSRGIFVADEALLLGPPTSSRPSSSRFLARASTSPSSPPPPWPILGHAASLHDAHRVLSPESRALVQAAWTRIVGTVPGAATYAELYATLVGEAYPALPLDPRNLCVGGASPSSAASRRTSSFRAAIGLVLELPARAAAAATGRTDASTSPRSPVSAPVVGSSGVAAVGTSPTISALLRGGSGGGGLRREGSKSSVSSIGSGMLSPQMSRGSSRRLIKQRSGSRDSEPGSPVVTANVLRKSVRASASMRSMDEVDHDIVMTSPMGGPKLLEMLGAKNAVVKTGLDDVDEDMDEEEVEAVSEESLMGDDEAGDHADETLAKRTSARPVKAKAFRF